MPITPIETAAMAPKSQAVTQIKQPEIQKPIVEQMNLNQQFNKDIQHNSMQTVKTFKSENNEYRYDAKEKGNGTYSNQNKKNGKGNTKDNNLGTKKSNSRPGSIDIKI
jgi:hypothetical protein